MPSLPEVEEFVVNLVGGFTGILPANVKAEWELKKPPLSFDNNRLAFLAMSLRGYVRHHSGNQNTVVASEVRKSGVTVKKVQTLVCSRVQGCS